MSAPDVSAENAPPESDSPGPEIDGWKLVLVMLTFGILASGTLWGYWYYHTAPFIPLQVAIADEFPAALARPATTRDGVGGPSDAGALVDIGAQRDHARTGDAEGVGAVQGVPQRWHLGEEGLHQRCRNAEPEARNERKADRPLAHPLS